MAHAGALRAAPRAATNRRVSVSARVCTSVPLVAARDGVVIIESSCGRSFNVSAEVAMQMSEHLIRSAARARGQHRMIGNRGEGV
jgi:hypothetical protein